MTEGFVFFDVSTGWVAWGRGKDGCRISISSAFAG